MREIKFRVWDKGRKRLAVVTTLDLEMGGLEYESRPDSALKFRTIAPLADCELMQYTGLKDKNGVEIYEGDISKTHHGLFEIKWLEYGWWLQATINKGFISQSLNESIMEFPFDASRFPEVVGNIYENKELLDGNAC